MRGMAGVLLWLPRGSEQRKTDWPSSRLPGEGGDKRAQPEDSLSMLSPSPGTALPRKPWPGTPIWEGFGGRHLSFLPNSLPGGDAAETSMLASLLDLSHHCERRLEDRES